MTFLEVWIGYAILGSAIFAAGLVWAVRHRQFTDMDSARDIALRAEDDIGNEPQSCSHNRADIAGLAGILLTAIAVIAAVVWIGLSSA